MCMYVCMRVSVRTGAVAASSYLSRVPLRVRDGIRTPFSLFKYENKGWRVLKVRLRTNGLKNIYDFKFEFFFSIRVKLLALILCSKQSKDTNFVCHDSNNSVGSLRMIGKIFCCFRWSVLSLFVIPFCLYQAVTAVTPRIWLCENFNLKTKNEHIEEEQEYRRGRYFISWTS